jgi:hypothetical protein
MRSQNPLPSTSAPTTIANEPKPVDPNSKRGQAVAAVRENLGASRAEIVQAIASKPMFKGSEKEAPSFFNWLMKPENRAAHKLPDLSASNWQRDREQRRTDPLRSVGHRERGREKAWPQSERRLAPGAERGSFVPGRKAPASRNRRFLGRLCRPLVEGRREPPRPVGQMVCCLFGSTGSSILSRSIRR